MTLRPRLILASEAFTDFYNLSRYSRLISRLEIEGITLRVFRSVLVKFKKYFAA